MKHDKNDDFKALPLVSIVLSSYNRPQKCITALDSIVNQSFDNYEIIIIDDFSTQEFFNQILNYTLILNKSLLHKIKVIRNLENIGFQASLVKAMKIVRGKYIARLDDDDYWISNHKLKLQVEFLETNKDYVLVGTNVQDQKGNKIYFPSKNKDIKNQILFRCPFCHSSTMFRLVSYKRIKGYNPKLKYSSDWDLWLQLGRLGKVFNLPKHMVMYDLSGDTMSKFWYRNQHSNNYNLVKSYFKSYPKPIKAKLYHTLTIYYFKYLYHPYWHSIPQRLFAFVFKDKFSSLLV